MQHVYNVVGLQRSAVLDDTEIRLRVKTQPVSVRITDILPLNILQYIYRARAHVYMWESVYFTKGVI